MLAHARNLSNELVRDVSLSIGTDGVVAALGMTRNLNNLAATTDVVTWRRPAAATSSPAVDLATRSKHWTDAKTAEAIADHCLAILLESLFDTIKACFPSHPEDHFLPGPPNRIPRHTGRVEHTMVDGQLGCRRSREIGELVWKRCAVFTRVNSASADAIADISPMNNLEPSGFTRNAYDREVIR